MRTHIVRDATIASDQAMWLEMNDDFVFVVSAQEVTAQGAAALVRAWSYFIESGEWASGGIGAPVSVTYRISDDMPEGAAVTVYSCRGVVVATLHPNDFTEDGAAAFERLARCCASLMLRRAS